MPFAVRRGRTAHDEAEARRSGAASFILSLRARGIRDIGAAARHGARAARGFRAAPLHRSARTDVALPLPCGQTMTAPAPSPTMLLALGVAAGPAGARNRHRQRLRDGAPGAARRRGDLGRALQHPGGKRGPAPQDRRGRQGRAIEIGRRACASRPRERFDRILLNGAWPRSRKR